MKKGQKHSREAIEKIKSGVKKTLQKKEETKAVAEKVSRLNNAFAQGNVKSKGPVVVRSYGDIDPQARSFQPESSNQDDERKKLLLEEAKQKVDALQAKNFGQSGAKIKPPETTGNSMPLASEASNAV